MTSLDSREVQVTAAVTDPHPVNTAPARGWRGPLVVGLLIGMVLVLHMGLWRRIWFDELLHFATGGMTFEYVVRLIDYTTIHVNHGQTGIYFLADWALLQVFGASAVALRAPSLLAALILLVSAVVFIRAKGFSWRWQALVVLALGANETLMFYAGEARPYMPLAASASAMLAFYALSADARRRWWARGLGAVGFLLGAVVHPYWGFIWFLVAGFSLLALRIDEPASRGPKEVWRFLAPGYVIPSALLALAVGQLTWMRRIITFGWDPDSIYAWPSLANAFLQDHFHFVPFAYPPRLGTGEVNAGAIVPAVVIALAAVTVVWLIIDRRSRSRRLIAPALLGVAALTSSLFASYMSYRSQYIIFERQWVAGMGLSAIAWTWFFGEWWRRAKGRSRWAAVPAAAFAGLTLVSFTIATATQAAVTVDRYAAWQEVKRDDRSLDELMTAAVGAESFAYDPSGPEDGYGYLASVNVARGGPVWDVFVRWYNKEAGMRQEFRESDMNWTDLIWREPSPLSYLCLPERQWECPVAPPSD